MSFSLPFRLPQRLCFRGAALKSPDLSWVDDFWRKAGPFIFWREEDGILILPPNRVYKLNKTAITLLELLKRGYKAVDIDFPGKEALCDTEYFFGDLAALYRGENPVNGTVGKELFSFSFSKLPILGEIAITYRCNNACQFCYAACGDALSQTCMNHPEKTTADYKKIIDAFADDAKIPFFSFTGGEPTLRRDLEELIHYARSRNLLVNLVTNGTLIDDSRARALKKAGLGSAQVSVEAPEQNLHDELTGRSGAFEETLAGIKALRNAGIPTQTNTTISRLNLPVIHQMPDFLKTLGITRFAMNLYIPVFAGEAADRLFVPYEEIGSYVELIRQKAQSLDMTFFWYSPTPFCDYNPIARGLGNKSCAALDGLISVAPDGAILPCSSWDEPVGNLLASSFQAVWFSEKAKTFKEKQHAPQTCRECSSFSACQGACPLYWRYTKSAPAGYQARIP